MSELKNNKMRILCITSIFPNKQNPLSGIFIYERAKELIKKGVYVEIILYNNMLSENNFLHPQKSYNTTNLGLDTNIHVNILNYFKIPKLDFFFFVENKLKNIFLRKNFDLLHFHYVSTSYVAADLKLKYNIPYIVTAHGSDIHTDPYQSKKKKKMVLNTLKNASQAIFVSKSLLNQAKKLGYKKNNHTIVPNGIDTKTFNKLPNTKEKKKQTSTIGFIGRLEKIKRAQILPDIFYHISKILPNTEFIIIGDGPLKSKIKNAADKLNILNKIQFKDFVPQKKLGLIINNIDTLVLPSQNEGLPCIVLEAQACGIPTVGSNNGGIPEAISNCGLLVNDGPDLEKRFANTIVSLLKNPIEKDKLLIKSKEFAWHNTVSEEIKVYQELLK